MGRTSLLMVMGFNLIFMIMGFNLSQISNKAYDNYINYYETNKARCITASAVNIAVGSVYADTSWHPSSSSITFNDGTVDWERYYLPNFRTQISAFGKYGGVEESTIVVLTNARFSRYAIYSEIENNIYWGTGDTCWGPLHAQQKLNVTGDPVFMDRVTTKNGIHKLNASDNPKFLGGYQSGVSVDLPLNLDTYKTSAANGGKVWNNTDVYLEFLADGKIVVREGGWANTATTYTLNQLAPNGVLLVAGGDLHIKGKVSGKLSIGATGSSGASKGNVYVDSSITYAHDPLLPNCQDMLGIVADNNVIVTNNNNNKAPGVTIHASMLCKSGGLTAEDYKTRGLCGNLNIVGGIQQKNREPVGQSSGGILTTGFHKNYRFDQRLSTDFPPAYPSMSKFQVLSWYEQIIKRGINIWE